MSAPPSSPLLPLSFLLLFHGRCHCGKELAARQGEIQLPLTWWTPLSVPLQRRREAVHEPGLLHVCSFYQYIYRAAALELTVASSLSRVVIVLLRKSVSKIRLALPHAASLQERSWQECRPSRPCRTDSLALDGAVVWTMRCG